DLALCNLDGAGSSGALLLPLFAGEVSVRDGGAYGFGGSALVDRSAAQGRYQDSRIRERRKAELEGVLRAVRGHSRLQSRRRIRRVSEFGSQPEGQAGISERDQAEPLRGTLILASFPGSRSH